MFHLGQVQNIEVSGKSYKLGRLTRSDMSQFIDWANERTPHPLDELTLERLNKYPPHLQEILLKNAQDKAEMRRSYTAPHIQGAINSPEGIIKLFELVLRKQHPEITYTAVAVLYDACLEEHGPDYLKEKLQRAQGVYDPGEDDSSGQKKTSRTTG